MGLDLGCQRGRLSLFSGFVTGDQVHQFHYDTYPAPPGATLLAQDVDLVALQAFTAHHWISYRAQSWAVAAALARQVRQAR